MTEVTTAPEIISRTLEIQGNRTSIESKHQASKEFQKKQAERGVLGRIGAQIIEPILVNRRADRLAAEKGASAGVSLARTAAEIVSKKEAGGKSANAHEQELRTLAERPAKEYKIGEQVIERVVGNNGVGKALAERLTSNKVKTALGELQEAGDNPTAVARATKKAEAAIRRELKALAKDPQFKNDPTVKEFFGENATKEELQETVIGITDIARELYGNGNGFQERLAQLDLILQKEFAKSGQIDQAYRESPRYFALQYARLAVGLGGLALFAVNPITGIPLIGSAAMLGVTTYFVQRHRMRFERVTHQMEQSMEAKENRTPEQKSHDYNRLQKIWGTVDWDASDEDFQKRMNRVALQRAGISAGLSFVGGSLARFGVETLIQHHDVGEAAQHFFTKATGIPEGKSADVVSPFTQKPGSEGIVGTARDELQKLSKGAGGYRAIISPDNGGGVSHPQVTNPFLRDWSEAQGHAGQVAYDLTHGRPDEALPELGQTKDALFKMPGDVVAVDKAAYLDPLGRVKDAELGLAGQIAENYVRDFQVGAQIGLNDLGTTIHDRLNDLGTTAHNIQEHIFPSSMQESLPIIHGHELLPAELAKDHLDNVNLHGGNHFVIDPTTGKVDIVDGSGHVLAANVHVDGGHLLGTYSDGSPMDIVGMEGKDITQFAQTTHVDFLGDTPQHNWQELHTSVQNDGGSNYILLHYGEKDLTGHQSFLTLVTQDGRHIFIQNDSVLALNGSHAHDAVAIYDGTGHQIGTITSADLAHQLGINDQSTIDNYATLLRQANEGGLWHGTQNASDLQVIMAQRGLLTENGGHALFSMRMGGGYFDDNGFHIGASNHYFDSSLPHAPLANTGFDVNIHFSGEGAEQFHYGIFGTLDEWTDNALHAADNYFYLWQTNPGGAALATAPYLALGVGGYLAGRSHNNPSRLPFITRGPHPMLSDAVIVGAVALALANPGFGVVLAASWAAGRIFNRNAPAAGGGTGQTRVNPLVGLWNRIRGNGQNANNQNQNNQNQNQNNNQNNQQPQVAPIGNPYTAPQAQALRQAAINPGRQNANQLNQIALQINARRQGQPPVNQAQVRGLMQAVSPEAQAVRGGSFSLNQAEEAAQRIVNANNAPVQGQQNYQPADLADPAVALAATQALGLTPAAEPVMYGAIRRAAIATQAAAANQNDAAAAVQAALARMNAEVDNAPAGQTISAADHARITRMQATALREAFMRGRPQQEADANGQTIIGAHQQPAEKAIAAVVVAPLVSSPQQDPADRVHFAFSRAFSQPLANVSQQDVNPVVTALNDAYPAPLSEIGATDLERHQALYRGARDAGVSPTITANALLPLLPAVSRAQAAAQIIPIPNAPQGQNPLQNNPDAAAFMTVFNPAERQVFMQEALQRAGVTMQPHEYAAFIAVVEALAHNGTPAAQFERGLEVYRNTPGVQLDSLSAADAIVAVLLGFNANSVTMPNTVEIGNAVRTQFAGLQPAQRAEIAGHLLVTPAINQAGQPIDRAVDFAIAATGLEHQGNTPLGTTEIQAIAQVAYELETYNLTRGHVGGGGVPDAIPSIREALMRNFHIDQNALTQVALDELLILNQNGVLPGDVLIDALRISIDPIGQNFSLDELAETAVALGNAAGNIPRGPQDIDRVIRQLTTQTITNGQAVLPVASNDHATEAALFAALVDAPTPQQAADLTISRFYPRASGPADFIPVVDGVEAVLHAAGQTSQQTNQTIRGINQRVLSALAPQLRLDVVRDVVTARTQSQSPDIDGAVAYALAVAGYGQIDQATETAIRAQLNGIPTVGAASTSVPIA